MVKKGKFIKPLLNITIKKQPSFNNQMKVLPKILVQNASLEISKTRVLKKNIKQLQEKNSSFYFTLNRRFRY